MPRVLMCTLVLGGLALAALYPSDTRAIEYVTVKIVCPEKTFAHPIWEPQIGSDPRFKTVAEEGFSIEVPFMESVVEGQTIYCRYKAVSAPPLLIGKYFTEAKQKVSSCTGAPDRVIQCKLNPDGQVPVPERGRRR